MLKLEVKFIETKVCSWCNKEKPLSEFYSQKKHSKKRGDWIYYHPECKSCTSKRAREYNLAHYDIYSKKQTKLFNTEKGKKLNRKSSKKWAADGKYKKWQQNNPEKLRIYQQNRRHKKHDIIEEEWLSCKKYFGNTCAYCGMTLEEHYNIIGTDFHQEHVDHFGSNDLSNCVPSCKNCNSQKWEFKFEEWYSENNPNFTQERTNKILQWINEDYQIYENE
jgi:hypothetical protein